MNENVLGQQTKTRFRVPVIILSVASLMLTLFSQIDRFVYYSGYSGFEFQFPSFSSWVYILSDVLAIFLFVVCALIFYKSKASRVFTSVVLGIYAIQWVYELFSYCIRECRDIISRDVRYYSVFEIIDMFFYTVLVFCFVASLIISVISAARGFPRKAFIIITAVIGMLIVFNFVIFFSVNVFKWWIKQGQYLNLFTRFADWFGMVLFHFSLLLFAFKTKRVKASAEAVVAEPVVAEPVAISPEQALRQLKKKLENGMITEEEYSIQRDEIINNL